MLSDPIRIADAINNPRFHPGDEGSSFRRAAQVCAWNIPTVERRRGMGRDQRSKRSDQQPPCGVDEYVYRAALNIAPQKEERKSDFMRKLGSIITLAVVSAALVYAAKRFPLNAASIVPAAKGSVEIGKDRNGNTEVKLKVEHLANPTSLSPSQANYVVWLEAKDSGPENEGELKVNGKLEGTFQTVTPRKNFELFVTGENDATVNSPSGPEVLRTSVSR